MTILHEWDENVCLYKVAESYTIEKPHICIKNHASQSCKCGDISQNTRHLERLGFGVLGTMDIYTKLHCNKYYNNYFVFIAFFYAYGQTDH